MKKQPHIWNECIVKWKSVANQQNKYVLAHRLREFRVYYADFFFFSKTENDFDVGVVKRSPTHQPFIIWY